MTGRKSRSRGLNLELLEGRVLLSSTVYVDAIAPGPVHDGSSWGNAYTSLQTALGAAVSGETIDVAQGIYYPTTATDRTATFQLENGVEIDGGFAGSVNPTAARNVAAYQTVLSGDIGVVGNAADNSYHVVTGSGTNLTAILDGVTISGGNANGTTGFLDCGGGMINVTGSPTVRNCLFTDNSTSGNLVVNGDGGGGMGNFDYSSPMVSGCTFSNNTASVRGGALDISQSYPTILNCVFSGNSTGAHGGAIIVQGSNATTAIQNCSFIGNSASVGGGIYFNFSTATVTDCSFEANTANSGGALYLTDSAKITAVNCTFADNQAASEGGAIISLESFDTVTNCTFTDNSAISGGGYWFYPGSSVLTNCIFWGDSGGEIVGATAYGYNDIEGITPENGTINADPQFVNAAAGNLQLQPTSPCVNVGSNAAINATGVTTDLAGNPRIVNSVVDMGAYEVQSAVTTWTGLGDGVDWSDPNNWTGQSVPTQGDVVTIPAGFSVIQVAGAAYSAGSVAASSPLEITSTGLLKLYGSSVLNSPLTIASGGTLDIQNNSLTINYAAGADPASTIRGYLKSAYAGGVWTGAGLTSSTVEAQVANTIKNPGSGVYALGYLDGAVDIGQTAVTGDQIVIEPALVGDTDLNGDTNFLDLGRTAQNLGRTTDWYHGDFNYDGRANFLDIGLLAQNLNKTILNTPLGAEVASGEVVAAPVTTASAAAPPKLDTGTVAVKFENASPATDVDAPAGSWPVTGLLPDGLFAETTLEDVLG
jgi:predicted outer membrane repeat protein